jgi:signal peptidase I
MFIFLISFMLIIVGCTEQTMTDPYTNPIVEKVKEEAQMMVIRAMYDGMDRGTHDFFQKQIVIDPTYYAQNSFSRGDILFFENQETENKSILRIIALPREKVIIKKGQIYINGKKLDTFYGRAHRLGKNSDELKQLLEKGFKEDRIKQNVKNAIHSLENADMDEIRIPEGHVFVQGDDWMRGSHGMVPIEKIIGKVLGYREG